MRGGMPVDRLTDEQLETMISNYRTRKVTEGGKWTLSTLLLEKRRRKPAIFPPRQLAEAIIRKTREAHDGLVTYGDLWKAFVPDRPWRGNNPRRIMADALYRVVGYCVSHDLPILTVLVVRASDRRLSPEAVANICHECRELGLRIGPDPELFVEQQRQRSLALNVAELPTDEN